MVVIYKMDKCKDTTEIILAEHDVKTRITVYFSIAKKTAIAVSYCY